MTTATARPWLSEPLVAAGLAFIVYATWVILYSVRVASSRVDTYGAPVPEDSSWLRPILGVVWVLVPLAVWVAIALILNRVTRAHDLPKRLVMSFLSAVIICAPVAVAAFVGLARSDGWGGLGAVGLAVPLAVPFFAVAFHLLAVPIVHGMSRRRRRGVSA